MMLRHQEALDDMFLGEEFPSTTTHVFKNYQDVATPEVCGRTCRSMLRERIVPQSEVISAILLEDSAYCGVPHLPLHHSNRSTLTPSGWTSQELWEWLEVSVATVPS